MRAQGGVRAPRRRGGAAPPATEQRGGGGWRDEGTRGPGMGGLDRPPGERRGKGGGGEGEGRGGAAEGEPRPRPRPRVRGARPSVPNALRAGPTEARPLWPCPPHSRPHWACSAALFPLTPPRFPLPLLPLPSLLARPWPCIGAPWASASLPELVRGGEGQPLNARSPGNGRVKAVLSRRPLRKHRMSPRFQPPWVCYCTVNSLQFTSFTKVFSMAV